MSSHHFVKEGQEPALLILDALPFHLAAPLLEWAPLVLVSDHALEDVLDWGIKIDVVLAEPGRAEILEERLRDQSPVKIVNHQRGKSLLGEALLFLIAGKQAGVNIIVSISENVFREAENFAGQLQVDLFDEKLKWSAVHGGNFEKWLAIETKLQIRKSLESQSIQIQGLTEKGGAFEVEGNHIISIRSDKLFWVAEQHS